MHPSDKQLRQARFWKKLLRLTRGRVTVLRALDVIIGEEPDATFQATVTAIRRDLESGLTLSDALRKQNPEFSPCVVELVRTAEATGAWDDILQESPTAWATGHSTEAANEDIAAKRPSAALPQPKKKSHEKAQGAQRRLVWRARHERATPAASCFFVPFVLFRG